MTMDIDTPEKEELSVFLHPLALIHMSDQYTRIRCGGSPLDATCSVEGILFGHCKTKNQTYYVEDAGDIPLEDATQQIDLHQAVFSTQAVLGWYKVMDPSSASYEPTAADLKQTQQIQARYQLQAKKKSEEEKETIENDEPTPTFFGLLQVPKQKKKASALEQAKKGAGAKKSDEDDDDEDELPLTLYQLDPDGGKSLVALSTWSLQTAESERIAVQRVIREKASSTAASSSAEGTVAPASDDAAAASSSSSGKEKSKSKSKKQAASTAPMEPPVPVGHNVVLPYMDEVAESCLAIFNRLTAVLEYLESPAVSSSSDPNTHLPLLRQVQGLLLQLGPIAATAPASSNTAMTNATNQHALQQLAQLSQAVQSVTLYAEKFKFLQEHGGGSSGGGSRGSARDTRRF